MTKTAATREATYQGLPAIELTLPDGSAAVVLLHGAHVLSWQAGGWGEQLYLSPKAVAAEGKAVRGGIPVIFPQFEQRGPDRSLPRHGLSRTRTCGRSMILPVIMLPSPSLAAAGSPTGRPGCSARHRTD